MDSVVLSSIALVLWFSLVGRILIKAMENLPL